MFNGVRPGNQREVSYAKPVFFSGTDATFSAIDLSGLIYEGDEKYSIIIWGWQSIYVASSSSAKGHMVLSMVTENNGVHGMMHASDDDNTTVMLPQPIILPEGSSLYWKVLDPGMSNNDLCYHEVYLTKIRSSE